MAVDNTEFTSGSTKADVDMETRTSSDKVITQGRHEAPTDFSTPADTTTVTPTDFREPADTTTVTPTDFREPADTTTVTPTYFSVPAGTTTVTPTDPSVPADTSTVTPTDEGQGDDDDEEEVDVSCGIWKFRTSVFGRRFSNLYVFAVCVGIAALFTAMVSEIIQVQLPSLQRQFNIDNARAGLFDTASTSGYLCTILLAGHFTKKSHIPVVVGLSGMVQGLMLLIPPILQFVDPYELPLVNDDNPTGGGDNDKYVCHSLQGNQTDSSQVKEVNRLAYNILIGLQVMKGVTNVFHAGFLPAIYIDDNLQDKSKMGILLGIQTVFQMLASPLGREINGVISELPIDFKETKMSTNDHRFVSAWWLGFLIFGIGTIVFSIPVMLFPRRLISRREQKTAEHKAVLQFAGGNVEEQVLSKGTPSGNFNSERKVSIMLTAPDSQVPVLLEESTHAYRKHSTTSHGVKPRRRSSVFPPLSGPTERKVSLTGDIVFEQPVAAPASKGEPENSPLQLLRDFPRATYRLLRRPIVLVMLFDVMVSSVPWSGVAFFRSTYMASEYNVPMSRVAYLSGIANAVGNTGGTIVSSLLCSRITTKIGYVLTIFLTYFLATFLTPLYLVFGCDNVPVYGATGEIGIAVNTSGVCDCQNVSQLLSCGADGNNYFSPCLAGCTDVVENVFFNCSLLSNHTTDRSLSPGLCATDCDRNFLIYVFVHGLQNFVTSSCGIAYRLLILRTVEPRDRGFAISLYIFFFNLFGIPAPNLFGRVVDNACYLSDGDTCTLYDRTAIRYLMSGIDVALHASSQVTSLMMLCCFKYEERQLKKQSQKGDDENPDAATDKINDGVDGHLQQERADSRRDSQNKTTRL